jgi:polysaccharide deacetylase family protein (PEP-CTERM system associated)
VAHAFSIDVEDWYQGIEIPMRQWDGFEQRVNRSMDRLLDLMAKRGVRATCFVLGRLAEEHPALVRRIHDAGHEIATHGYSHAKVYDLSRVRFRRELRRSIDLLQDLTGERVCGHRAPYFTVTEQSRWALDVLAEEGIRYDSSIHPVFNHRYGIARADRLPSVVTTQAGNRLLEAPVATLPLFEKVPLVPRVNLPVGGGAYLRLYPYPLQRRFLRALERRGERFGLYVHPWEVDPHHPRLDDLPLRVSATHYVNLGSTFDKLDALLGDFAFAPYCEVYADEIHTLQSEAPA